MYVRCCLVKIARKDVTETANVGRKLSDVGLHCSVALRRCHHQQWLFMADSRSSMAIIILYKQ